MKQFIQLDMHSKTGTETETEGADWVGLNILDVKYIWEWRWPTIRRVKNYFDPSDTKKYWRFDLSIVKKYWENYYETMIYLKDGDKLTIYKDYSAMEVLWQGVIKKDTTANQIYDHWVNKLCTEFQRYGDVQPLRYSLSKYGFETEKMEFADLLNICKQCFSQQTSNNYWCHWLQEGVDPDVWGRYFLDERYAYLERDE
jgi:hypothetical protein